MRESLRLPVNPRLSLCNQSAAPSNRSNLASKTGTAARTFGSVAIEKMGRDMDGDRRTVGRNWRMRPDDDRPDRDGYARGSYDEDRPQRRVKVCFEYENGDEYCRYR
jgi:hypothetical protein